LLLCTGDPRTETGLIAHTADYLNVADGRTR
jgi:hypothetical protein